MFNNPLQFNRFASKSQINSAAKTGLPSLQQRVNQLEQMMTKLEVAQQKAKPAFGAVLSTAEADLPAPPTFQSVLGNATPPPKLTPMTTPVQKRQDTYNGLIEQYAQQYGIDAALVKAVIRQESGFNPNAVSRVGAQGLMQLMPATAKSLGVTNAFNPEENIAGGVKYLSQLMTQTNGNIPLTLAAYNAGPGAVKEYGGIPPYQETQAYVKRVLTAYLSQKGSNPN